MVLVLLVLALAACAAPTGTTSPTTSPTIAPSAVSSPAPSTAPSVAADDRVTRWRAAIAAVLPGIERLHRDPFHGTPRTTFETALADLDARVATLTDDELLVGLMRVFALVSAGGRDAHTGLYAWGYGTYPLHSLPVQVWLFDDGPRVVSALPPYEDLVGARIAAIEGQRIDDVLALLEPLVPRDNDATVRLLLPRFVILTEVLHGVGVTTSATDSVGVTVTGDDGQQRELMLDPIPMADYNAWAGPYGLFLPPDPDVLARSNPDPSLWTATPSPGVVYVGYQSLDGVDRAALDELERLLADDATTDVVVDVRRNTGGEYHAIDTVLAPLLEATGGTGSGQPRLWVLTGRNTFSGASLFVARLTGAREVTIVGETMAGSPSTWADPDPLRLGETGLEAQVSTTFDVGADAADDRLSIPPDLAVDTTWQDVAAGRDPVLDAVLAAAR